MSSSTLFTGNVQYGLTNDYMFRALLQKNETALKNLIACLLYIPVSTIISVEILNPIVLGEKLDDKTCVLDLRIRLNNNQLINLEMQVKNYDDWPERSLYYLARTFAMLRKGQTYADVLPTIHIGILNFTLFEESKDFYSEYLLQNTKTHQVYSDKFAIRVLDLTQIEAEEAKKEQPHLYYWAKLFVAKTWEEIQMLSNESEDIRDAVVTFKELSADEKIQLQCEAREMYEHTLASAKRSGKLAGIREGKSEIARNMLKKGMAVSDICEITGLAEEDVCSLQ